MSNILRLYRDDLRSMFRNTIAGIIVLGLVFLPSIFSWYNILACWNVFDNTGNLTVAVANSDAGYESDLVPLRINVGERVESALRANDQLNWVFTEEEDAIEGVKSGKYYAAVVIPPSFSQDMMTFYSNDAEHAKLVYYTNEKKSAVAPKVTDQGADRVSYQVNEVFIKTLTEIALDIAKGVQKYANESDLSGHIGSLANTVDAAAGDIGQTASVLRTYSAILSSAEKLLTSSAALINQTGDSLDGVKRSIGGMESESASTTSAIMGASAALGDALKQASSGYGSLEKVILRSRDSAGKLTGDSALAIREHASKIESQISSEQELIDELNAIASTLDTLQAAPLKSVVSRMESAIDMQRQLKVELEGAASNIENGQANAEELLAKAGELSRQAESSLTEISSSFDSDVKPKLDDVSARVSASMERIGASEDALGETADTLAGKADSASSRIKETRAKLDVAADKLEKGASDLRGFSAKLANALTSESVEQLRDVLGSDPSVLANALAAPVLLERNAVFPAENFGSQMAPLYTVLAMWVGSLLLVVAIKVGVSEEARRKLDNPTLSQIFLGRFGIFATLSLMQTTVMGLGNWLFLGVQVDNPLLFMLCFWFSGLVFVFIMYTLVVSFANLGKAFGVLLLILQVTAAGGSFPLQLLPSLFQVISPYVPATHVINMMRASMMGVYQNDFWIEMGELALFVIPMLVLGLALRKPLIRFLNWYVERVEDSKLVN